MSRFNSERGAGVEKRSRLNRITSICVGALLGLAGAGTLTAEGHEPAEYEGKTSTVTTSPDLDSYAPSREKAYPSGDDFHSEQITIGDPYLERFRDCLDNLARLLKVNYSDGEFASRGRFSVNNGDLQTDPLVGLEEDLVLRNPELSAGIDDGVERSIDDCMIQAITNGYTHLELDGRMVTVAIRYNVPTDDGQFAMVMKFYDGHIVPDPSVMGDASKVTDDGSLKEVVVGDVYFIQNPDGKVRAAEVSAMAKGGRVEVTSSPNCSGSKQDKVTDGQPTTTSTPATTSTTATYRGDTVENQEYFNGCPPIMPTTTTTGFPTTTSTTESKG